MCKDNSSFSNFKKLSLYIVDIELGDNKSIVEIVMIEKLDCILSKRATRPVYI